MDVRTQDGLARLMSKPEWAYLMHHIRDRMEVYHTSLATVDPARVDFVASYQGRVAAYTEILGLETYVDELKRERANNG
jgi:hypothetical protein